LARARRAAVVTPFFVDHDAVCNDVFHSAAALRRHGWEACVFAAGGGSSREQARPLAELQAFVSMPTDLLYFHFSTGHAPTLQAVRTARCRRVMKYHNITPPEFFSLWSDELAEASRLGRIQLPQVAALPWERVIGASRYNLTELAPHIRPGTPLEALPPFHDVAATGAADISGMRLLTVGRLAPSKGHAFLLRMLRYLVHDLGIEASLDIVGKTDARMVSYARLLSLMVREFGLEGHVRFHGELDAAQLEARYREAALFVMASDHEGFCVPLAEAMAFGLPVVALGTSAIPETVGDAGIVWDERDPRRFGATVKRLLEEPSIAHELAERGRRRYAEMFAPRAIESRLIALLDRPPA
jgi:glycosyltransferase involved in cell wall biosynthesis